MAITDYAVVDVIRTQVTDITYKLRASLDRLKRRTGWWREFPQPIDTKIPVPPRIYQPDELKPEVSEVDVFTWSMDEGVLPKEN